jgi:A/G-specific adenine glycosylase
VPANVERKVVKRPVQRALEFEPRVELSKFEKGAALVEKLGAWFDVARRDLPWRKTRDPYAIWLSEVMLQQTRVKTVEDYFPRFLHIWPTVGDLAKADLADVLGAWSGLGYYRRARALYAGAREVVEKYGGKLPNDAAELRAISGIGPYTAGAISSIAFGAKEPLVDGNVARVFARIFALTCDVRTPSGSREVWDIAKELVPADRPGRHNESLMELGATVCLPREPRCDVCPVRTLCEGRAQGIEKDLPIAKKKKPPREVSMLALVSRRGQSVLLARRRSGGLFGGLWEPPMIEWKDANGARSTSEGAPESAPLPRATKHVARDDGQRARATRINTSYDEPLRAMLGVDVKNVEHVAEQTHILTHRRIRITIATGRIRDEPRAPAGEIYDCLAWKGASELESLPMSSLARKVLLACPG